MLERLTELSDDHFNVHSDEVTWGHVGTLEHYAEVLKRITDSALSTPNNGSVAATPRGPEGARGSRW